MKYYLAPERATWSLIPHDRVIDAVVWAYKLGYSPGTRLQLIFLEPTIFQLVNTGKVLVIREDRIEEWI